MTTGLAPWIQAQLGQLLSLRGHAWLLQGPSGLGQYPLAMALASAWLCEAPVEEGACGTCGSCHSIEVRTHADLFVLMPETVMLQLGWPLSEKAQGELDKKERKPSKEVRVDAMRDAVEFSQRTSARGRGKVVLIFPADRMNTVTANALLKTLEEPPGDVRFVLATEAAHQLLPTVRSRCLTHTMQWPAAPDAMALLIANGMAEPDARALLRASGQRPDNALQLHQRGVTSALWSQLPRNLASGNLAAFADWAAADLVDALQKLCHDLLVVAAGGSPRFYEKADLPRRTDFHTLAQWWRDLSQTARTVEHPFNAGLFLEALVAQGQRALRLP